MIIVMSTSRQEDVDHVVARVEEFGYKPHVIYGVERTVVAAVGDERGKERLTSLESLPYVEQVIRILKPFKLAGREVKQENTVIECAGVLIGGNHFALMAGPCSVESEEQIMESARIAKEAGANILRGGAFKPRTSPYSFQGMEMEGLRALRKAADAYHMPFVTEATTPEQIPVVAQYADMIQIGARNMQNYGLLRAAGKAGKPVLLKRGMMSTINEFLMSAEYILSEGNPHVILCERGIRTFETETRNTLDIQAVPVVKLHSHLPVIVDPSHAAGRWDIIIPMACAAVAAGADGIIVEMHPNPEVALSDGQQSLRPKKFQRLVETLKPLLAVMKKEIS
ncbi:MAG TPA: 3-deoxy-7-phosphoheptulonate synthase [Candidatus Hydrogenedentes bacterium]|jgi:3-deoxy-7-phosphoheptulonate synthase|nr:MAG: Phospho-2-dehydro-3-deoxyheptonate aldolase [Candidatus Hydrogenedentes bacterium ADurb.Bin170]HNZ48565.1 3-deoxy-7-phosphoheptulonate synthase [Candidatus Hydrogenedentota bacterium]HOD96264.1 3-deoxy-7-phosphoheptulonate synthase [Candidatus Hydrogenedentota bacterium]HOM46983.1 3-deoxy-7-phosphoheptulonate synthase [Candidatus Hydrogenedentota bacterium]HOR50735.1 3-deoxy-7-phosphoheptulonate synthase [Candidatus Hydrogenedentota bacterium]